MKKPTKADISLLSRALTMARGMVSPEYLKAEKSASMKKAGGGKAKKMMKGGGKAKKYMAGGGKTKKYMARGGKAR